MKAVSLFLQRVKIIHKKFVDMKSHCPIACHLMKGGNLLLGIQPDSIAHFHKKSLPGYQPSAQHRTMPAVGLQGNDTAAVVLIGAGGNGRVVSRVVPGISRHGVIQGLLVLGDEDGGQIEAPAVSPSSPRSRKAAVVSSADSTLVWTNVIAVLAALAGLEVTLNVLGKGGGRLPASSGPYWG